MKYNKELEDSIIEYIDLPDPIDKVAEEKEIAYENGKYEGQKEGREEGLEDGIVHGERHAKIIIANTMYVHGEPIKKIAEYTNMPLGEVRSMFINEPLDIAYENSKN